MDPTNEPAEPLPRRHSPALLPFGSGCTGWSPPGAGPAGAAGDAGNTGNVGESRTARAGESSCAMPGREPVRLDLPFIWLG